eukprot:Platyproteum_vivax@DN1136_c0_g1_i1.p2
MAEVPYTVRTRNFLKNPLLLRKQFTVDVLHPGRANVSKKDIRERLAQSYKVSDINCIILFGFKTAFGGGHSSGFGLIYDSAAACKQFEKNYRLARFGMFEGKVQKGRRQFKETKSRRKKARGMAKSKAGTLKKRVWKDNIKVF